MTNPLGHLWRDKWIALSGPLSGVAVARGPVAHSVAPEAQQRALNMAHTRRSRPDSGLSFQVKIPKIITCSLFTRKRGVTVARWAVAHAAAPEAQQRALDMTHMHTCSAHAR